jgi:hypothetical protein
MLNSKYYYRINQKTKKINKIKLFKIFTCSGITAAKPDNKFSSTIAYFCCVKKGEVVVNWSTE